MVPLFLPFGIVSGVYPPFIFVPFAWRVFVHRINQDCNNYLKPTKVYFDGIKLIASFEQNLHKVFRAHYFSSLKVICRELKCPFSGFTRFVG